MDSQTRRNGRALEYLGHYNPMVEPNEVTIDHEKVKSWIDKGAKPTETVRSLLKQTGYYEKQAQ
jgi:small subunit ribosomal protein S16